MNAAGAMTGNDYEAKDGPTAKDDSGDWNNLPDDPDNVEINPTPTKGQSDEDSQSTDDPGATEDPGDTNDPVGTDDPNTTADPDVTDDTERKLKGTPTIVYKMPGPIMGLPNHMVQPPLGGKKAGLFRMPRVPLVTGPGMPEGKNNNPNAIDQIPCGRSHCCSGADFGNYCTCHYCERDKNCCNPNVYPGEDF